MLTSYLLSRTLVPTMVLYLLPVEVEAEGGNPKSKARNPKQIPNSKSEIKNARVGLFHSFVLRISNLFRISNSDFGFSP